MIGKNMRKEKGAALVTDGRLIMSLAIIRSLGRTGIKVNVMESCATKHRFIPGFYSRYTSTRILYKDFLTSLTDEAGRADVIFPVSGESSLAMAAPMDKGASSDAFSVFSDKVALPKRFAIETANDKTRLNQLAGSLGVPVPKTYHPEQSLDVEASLAKIREEIRSWGRHLSFPVIVKYRYGEALRLPADQRYRVVRNPEELAEAYVQIHSRQPFPLVQEYIPGEDFGAAILCDKDSHVVASFSYRSIRQRPRLGGPTTCAESRWYPPMVAHLEKIAKALSWYGLAMGDFRRTPDGEFRLLEINPRFWGSLALSVESGVDFPLLYYQLVANKGYLEDAAPRQKDGVSLKFFFQDLSAIREYSKTSTRPWLYLAEELTKTILPKRKDAVFQLVDPMPGIAYILDHVFS